MKVAILRNWEFPKKWQGFGWHVTTYMHEDPPLKETWIWLGLITIRIDCPAKVAR